MMGRIAVAVLCATLFCAPAWAQENAQTTLHLLDYVGADYGGAVENGAIRSADEYREMQEFVAQAGERLKSLPDNPAKPALLADARRLVSLVAARAAPAEVADLAAKLRQGLAAAYEIPLAPRRPPDLARGAAVYAAECAACHGASGHGDGPAARGLAPAPADFHDAARMVNRSAYGLYNTITLGVAGTSMAANPRMREDDRWALAFLVAGLAANAGERSAQVREGEALWKAGQGREVFRSLADVTSLSSAEMHKRHGEAAARIQAYLVSHPDALAADKPLPIAFARASLARALDAYRRGDAAAARELATVAYLEGFELVEAGLDNVDQPLRLSIERDMIALRTAIAKNVSVDALAAQIAQVDAQLAIAQGRLSEGNLSPGAAFVSALVILLREGLEAILLLAAIIAFVKRTGRQDALRHVHAGWVLALALGAATWAAANYLFDISGANRELTEGITALFAAAMLLYVGYWLHGRTQAQAWSAFLRDTVGQALDRKTLWAMVGVSFLAVYREIFEVVLFYEALWMQAGEPGRGALWAGVALAALLLALAGWGIFKYSIRLPLAPFFAAMSLLLALLAVVFAGQGIAALQEAGIVEASHVAFVTVQVLGIHPTLETLGAQLACIALIVLGRRLARAAPRSAKIDKAKAIS